MNHLPEFFEKPHHAPAERAHHNHHVQNHDFHNVGHHRREQSAHDSHKMSKEGKLPSLDITGHDHQSDSGKQAKHDKAQTRSHGEKLDNGMVKFSGLHGAAVDTDGAGAKNHKEDRTRQHHTSLRDERGNSLDTDKDKFVALPKSVMKEHGIKLGDHGFLERADTGEKVPVVFGDVSSGKQWKNGTGQPEASVAALKALGFNNVNGARGVDKSVAFNLTMDPGSKASKGLMI